MVLCINVMFFWDVILRSLADEDQCFGGSFLLSSTETADFSKTFCAIWQIT
jgi:hypothetical protein